MLAITLLLGGGVVAFLGLSRAGAGASAGAGGLGGATVPGGFIATRSIGLDAFPIVVPVVGAACLAAVVLIPPFMVRSAQRRWESRADDDAATRRVYGGFVQLSVVQAALLEGPGLLGAVATYLTGNGFYLGAPLAAVVCLAVLFPRAARVARWIDEVTGRPLGPAVAQPLSLDDEAA